MELKETLNLIGALLIAFVGIMAFAILLPKFISASLKSSRPYSLGQKAVLRSSEACELLGEPITFGVPAGTISGPPPICFALLQIPVQGSRGQGVLYLNGRMRVLTWNLSRCELNIAGCGTIDLRQPPTS